MRTSIRNSIWRLVRGVDVPIWYHPCYRPPIAPLEARTGMEPRRADFVAWYLVQCGAIARRQLRAPTRVTYRDLALVHTKEYLETLTDPSTLGRVFGVDPGEISVDELLRTVRLAVGGTIAAAREALARRIPALNLLGGFHHAGISRGGGSSPVNDIAVAVAILRRGGLAGKVVVIDLDAHPPDGTAECLRHDPASWIGSISGSRWAELEGVDETVLQPDTGDRPYLDALSSLLRRAPTDPALAFVVAGGDVLKGDRLGTLGLSLDGARRRDLMVRRHFAGVPSVWLPGGGYSDSAWRVLAGTGLALAIGSRRPISRRLDPLHLQYAEIAESIRDDALSGAAKGSFELSLEDLEDDLGFGRSGSRLKRVLGFYSREGIEQALFRYGVLEQIERLGYDHLTIEIDRVSSGERLRVFGQIAGRDGPAGARELLVEAVVERRHSLGMELLFVAWLTLRHPRARFTDRRPRLPGQDVPGLGLAREAGELFGQMAKRLGLAGVLITPAHYHVAYQARGAFKFVDAARQGRFSAMLRDLCSRASLLEITNAVDEGRVWMNGVPYAWEPIDMVHTPEGIQLDEAVVATERERVKFELLPAAPRESGG